MLMGNGLEFMREHIPSNARVHYIITNGGAAPNIVPDTATMELMARSPTLTASSTASGSFAFSKLPTWAALMTETTLAKRISKVPMPTSSGTTRLPKLRRKIWRKSAGSAIPPKR